MEMAHIPVQSQHCHRRILWVLAVAMVMIFYPFVALQADAGLRIAVVDIGELIKSSPQTKAAEEQLKANFVERERKLAEEQKLIAQREEELKNLTASGSLSEEERIRRERDLRELRRNHSRALEDFREEVRQARDAAIDRVQDEIVQAIAAVREQQQIDIVLRENQYVVATKQLDITGQVLQQLAVMFGKQNAPATPPPKKD